MKEIAHNDTYQNGKLTRREVVEITYDENGEVVSEQVIEVIEYELDSE